MSIFREFEFASNPELVADKLINSMSDRFSQPELNKVDIARILTGFHSVRNVTGKKIDALFFSYMRESAIRSGKLNENEFFELLTTLPEGGYGEFMSFDEMAGFTKYLKQEGYTVGLKFGHYRRLTMGHIFEFMCVRKTCDYLIQIIESNERTLKFKTDKLELSDDQRIRMFKDSCLVHSVGMTSGTDYSNEYYRDIVKTVRPSILFASASWPEQTQVEYRMRAKSVNAELCIMPNVVSITTTMMEPQIFR